MIKTAGVNPLTNNLPKNALSSGMVMFLACQSQVVAVSFAIAFRKSEHLSRSLADEVERQTRDIKSILGNIRQGIFSGGGKIVVVK